MWRACADLVEVRKEAGDREREGDWWNCYLPSVRLCVCVCMQTCVVTCIGIAMLPTHRHGLFCLCLVGCGCMNRSCFFFSLSYHIITANSRVYWARREKLACRARGGGCLFGSMQKNGILSDDSTRLLAGMFTLRLQKQINNNNKKRLWDCKSWGQILDFAFENVCRYFLAK